MIKVPAISGAGPFEWSSTELWVQIFSIITALSFLISVLVQAAIFLVWGLDFTAIASIEDVIMGGIRFFGLTLVTATALVPLMAWGWLRRRGGLPRWTSAWVVRFLVLALLYFTFVGSILYLRWVDPNTLLRFGQFRVVFIILFVSMSAMVAVWVLTSPWPVRIMLDLLGQGMRVIIILSLASSVFLVSVNAATGAYTNIVIVNDERLPSQCRRDRQGFHRIQWIGTRALVIECKRNRFVLLVGDSPPLLGALSSRQFYRSPM